MRLPRRFDDALMAPPDAGAPVDAALLAAVRAWCEGGTEPLRVASVASDAGLDGVACALDGSHELVRLGRWRGLFWRLQILWRECVAGRGAQSGIPGDCGWWREGALESAETFRPRRATLLMVRETTPALVAALLAKLHASSSAYDEPVHVLLVSVAPIDGIGRLAQLTVDGSLSIRPAQWNRKTFALELAEAREAMPMSESVIGDLRAGARY